jgi:2-polyprenyl-3-methyl-5-hydroxy-6-metoxy-1,4-benzoquinol methylase
VEYHPGEVGVLLVNERIVEQPYVFASVAEACAGGPVRILDVGGSESTVALSLASLGHDVTVVDPRPCPLQHPRLTFIEQRLEDLPADLPPFDVAISLSAIEHFGLEHYGTARGEDRADLQAIGHLRERLRPGGMLILTVPIGEPSVDAFQRVYDLAGVRELVGGFTLENLAVVRQVDRLTWEPASPDEDDHRRGVALVRARRP